MKRILKIALPLGALLIAGYFALGFLTPALPEPTGKHAVGHKQIVVSEGDKWVDVQMFYPAKEAVGEQIQAMPADLAEQMSKSFGVPTVAMLDERVIPAFTDAPAIVGLSPLLIFNHGHGMFATQNSHNVLELASHGYIVLSLSHPGHSLISKNGDEAVLKQEGIAEYEEDEIKSLLLRQQRGNNELRATNSLSEWTETMAAIQVEAFADIVDQFPVWIENNEIVLNALTRLQSGEIKSPVQGAIDLEKIGYFGHSFGGAVATHMNMNDERIKASFNMDGPVFTWSIAEQPTGAHCFAYGDTNNQAGVETDFSLVNTANCNSDQRLRACF